MDDKPAYIAKPIKNIENADIDNKNNLKCFIDTDFNKYNQLSTKYNYVLKIAVAVNALNGFGDIIFSIKFVKYLIKTFINIEVIYIIDKLRGIQFVENLEEFDNVSILFCDVEIVKDKEDSPYIYIIKSDKEIDCNILFISPKTSGQFQFKFKNESDVLNNTYSLSEYNPFDKPTYKMGSSIETGIGTELAGLLLNNARNIPFMKSFKTPYYSVCYFYLDEINIKKMTLSPVIKFGKYTIEQASLQLFNIDIQILFKDLDKQKEFLRSDKGILLILLKFSLCYQEYLREISKLSPLNNVSIFIKNENYEVIKKFINSLSIENINFFNLSYIREEINKLNIIDLKPVRYNDFLKLLEYSLPVVFLTGDQSITDFITINKNFKYSIFYQIFNWKKIMANNLTRGEEFSVCGKISADMLNLLKIDLRLDFRFAGLILIQSALIYCLQYLLNKKEPMVRLCESIDLPKNIYEIINSTSIIQKLLTGKYKKSSFNSKIKIEDNIIICSQDNSLDLDFILGNLSNKNTIDWLPGSNINELLIKYTQDTKSNNILKYDCSSFSIKIDKENILNNSVYSLLMYSFIRNIYRNDNFLRNHITNVYGNYLLTDECNEDIKKRFEFSSKITDYLGCLILVDNFSHKYITFKSLILSVIKFNLDFNIIVNLFKQFLKIIRLFYTKYNIKYNNLNLDDIFIEQSNDPGDYLSYNIKLNNFDNSFFKIDETPFYNIKYDEVKDYERSMYNDIINTNETYFTKEKRLKLELLLKTKTLDGRSKKRSNKRIRKSNKRSNKRSRRISNKRKSNKSKKISRRKSIKRK
jgi:hypothetical protein